jgi:hypothetical protein
MERWGSTDCIIIAQDGTRWNLLCNFFNVWFLYIADDILISWENISYSGSSIMNLFQQDTPVKYCHLSLITSLAQKINNWTYFDVLEILKFTLTKVDAHFSKYVVVAYVTQREQSQISRNDSPLNIPECHWMVQSRVRCRNCSMTMILYPFKLSYLARQSCQSRMEYYSGLLRVNVRPF